MKAPSDQGCDRRSGRLAAAILSVVALAALATCSPSPFPGETEEIRTDSNDVPDLVRTKAEAYCERLGSAECTEWFWDTEDKCWEATVVGLSRRAELDIELDGAFSELELVYDFAEVEKILPHVAAFILEKSRNDRDVLIELSLRKESFLDDLPDLAEAWTRSGVIIEFQCSNGWDFEIDPKGQCVSRKVDDTKDPSRDPSSEDLPE